MQHNQSRFLTHAHQYALTVETLAHLFRATYADLDLSCYLVPTPLLHLRWTVRARQRQKGSCCWARCVCALCVCVYLCLYVRVHACLQECAWAKFVDMIGACTCVCLCLCIKVWAAAVCACVFVYSLGTFVMQNAVCMYVGVWVLSVLCVFLADSCKAAPLSLWLLLPWPGHFYHYLRLPIFHPPNPGAVRAAVEEG